MHATVNEHSEEPWQSLAQDREVWHLLEQAFIARVTRMAPLRVSPVLLGRDLLQQIPEHPRASTVALDLIPCALLNWLQVPPTFPTRHTLEAYLTSDRHARGNNKIDRACLSVPPRPRLVARVRTSARPQPFLLE